MELQRALGMRQAVLLGLGSILGTGVFVSIFIVADIAGPSTLWAILVGATVASLNGLSSAQLAANHPLSGGTYEYGYRWLNPLAGFTAGWMFLCAKSASAASAALGVSAYLLQWLNRPLTENEVPLACLIVCVITALVCLGIRRSSQANTIMVTITLIALGSLIAVAMWHASREHLMAKLNFFSTVPINSFVSQDFFYASALMFVAYTGYGRIATMSEEVVNPRKTIPVAIITTLLIAALVYLSVGAVVLGFQLNQPTSLQELSAQLEPNYLPIIVTAGAATAMLGVLLNLILGLSRVTLAMSRRGDLPAILATVTRQNSSPTLSVIVVGIGVLLLCLIGDLRTTWSLSALTVLIYYSITNASALALSRSERLYPPWISGGGLIACLTLTVFIPTVYWLYCLALIASGLTLRWVCRSLHRSKEP